MGPVRRVRQDYKITEWSLRLISVKLKGTRGLPRSLVTVVRKKLLKARGGG